MTERFPRPSSERVRVRARLRRGRRTRSSASAAALSDPIFVAPLTIARRMAPILPLALRELPINLPTNEWTLVWHPRVDRDPASLWLRDARTAALAQSEPGPRGPTLRKARRANR